MSGLLAPAVTGYVLRSYQQNAVNRSVEFLTNPRLRGRNGLVVLPTGAGKSLVIAGIATRLDAPVLVFQPSKEILQQNAEKLRGYGYMPAIWSASLNRKRVGQITLATIGSVVNHVEAFRHFKYVLIDECFVAGTRVGGRPIEDFRPGDFVWGFDHAKARPVRARVVATSRRPAPSTLVRVTIDGRCVVCTPNHPFFVVGRGYVAAAELQTGDPCAHWSLSATGATDAALFTLRSAGRSEECTPCVPLQENGASLPPGVRPQARRCESVGTHAGEEPDGTRRLSGADGSVVEEDRAPAERQGRERSSDARTSAASARGAGTGVAAGVHGADGAPSGGVSALLPDRCGTPGADGRRGDRRAEPQASAESVRPAQDRVLVVARVERVEILERGCDDGSGKGHQHDYVYNLEVEGVNNYFADGILVHNCHLVNAKGGMYRDFLAILEGARVIGLTATPYRLASDSLGAQLRFLTRTRPRIFHDVVYYLNTGPLFRAGFLAPLTYHEPTVLDTSRVRLNSTGADFDDRALQQHFADIGFGSRLHRVVEQLLADGHKSVLVFTRFLEESEALAAAIPGTAVVSAETKPDRRAQILWSFKKGLLRVVTNVGVLTVGFDYPELTTVVLARPTMSLSVYYQQVGRVIRPHPSKPTAHVVDLVGLKKRFGPIEQLWMQPGGKTGEQWVIVTGEQRDRVLTNVPFGLPRNFTR